MHVLNMMVWAYFFIYLTDTGMHIVLCSEDQVKGINGDSAIKTCVMDCVVNLLVVSIMPHPNMRLYILVQGGEPLINYLSSVLVCYYCECFIHG